MWQRIIIVACGCLCLIQAPAAEYVTKQYTWDFESDAVGREAAGFRTAVGAWSVAAEGPNRVLAQTAQNADAVFNLLLRTDVLFSDVDVSVRLKAVKGTVD